VHLIVDRPGDSARVFPPVALAGITTTVHILTALATDVDLADIGAFIEWSESAGPARGRGASFVFTPDTVGVHQLRATVTDSLGSTARAVMDVRVSLYRSHSPR